LDTALFINLLIVWVIIGIKLLRWSHSQLSHDPKFLQKGYLRKGRHCDFGHILGPGKRVTLEIKLPSVASGKTGDGFAGEDKMFSDGIGMREIY
jgi:hypothetical protein